MSGVVSLTTAAAQGSAKSISRRAQWLLFEASACSLGGLFGEGGGQGRSPALGCPIPASALCWGPGGHPVGVTRAVHAPRAPGIPAMSLFRPQPPVACAVTPELGHAGRAQPPGLFPPLRLRFIALPKPFCILINSFWWLLFLFLKR